MANSLNATFFAFRKRDKGGVLLGATVTFALISILVSGVFIYLNWQAFGDYINWVVSIGQATETSGAADPSAPFAGMMPPPSVMALGPAYFLFMFVYYLLLASYEAACLRWMIRGETKGLFGLALDADTLRVYFTYWLWFFLLIALYIVIAIIAVGLGVGAAMSAQGNSEAAGPAMLLIPLIVVLTVFSVLIFFGVRFAPAAATSIAKRRFAFFDAWTVTKGRFWALLGSFALLFLMYFVGAIILSVAMGMATGLGMMGQMQTGADPQTAQDAWAMFSAPSVLIPLIVCYALLIVGAFMFYVALFGINARAALAAIEDGKIQAG